MNKKVSSLIEDFNCHFAVELARSEKQKSEAKGIRYRVYCEEFGYEPKAQFPDGEESDEYDEHSEHCLIRHKSSGLPAGCVRLVPTNDTSEIDPLPFEKRCAHSVDREFLQSLNGVRTSLCEISRLAVDTAFRRRSGDEASRYGDIEAFDFSPKERRNFPIIAMSAYLAATALTSLTGRTNVFAMMEPFLPRLMKRTGLVFQKVGQDVDCHGLRAPYFITTQSAIEEMNKDLKSMYDRIHPDLKGVW